MVDTKSPSEKKLSVSGKTLTLKPRSETGVVRQSFSHGRSKSVVVEKVKRRVIGGSAAEPKAETQAATPAPAPEKKSAMRASGRAGAAAAPASQPTAATKPSGVVL